MHDSKLHMQNVNQCVVSPTQGLLCIWRFVTAAMALETAGCGTLKIRYECHNQHVDAKLHLSPSEAFKTCINRGKVPRWWFITPSLTRRLTEDTKYEMSNYSLTIHNFNESDEETYTIDCIGEKNSCRADSSKVKAPVNKECDARSTQSTKTSPLTSQRTELHPVKAASPAVVLSNTVIAVIAVCVVIIVIVIAGTVLIVVHRGTNTRRSTRRHATSEGGSTLQLHREESRSTVYHSIDRVLENGEADNLGFCSSKLSLLSLHTSPALPKRPKEEKPIKEEENDYDLIRDSLINDKDVTNRIKVETNVAVVQMDMNVLPCDDGYTTISAEGNFIKEGTKSVSLNKNTIPEYSKVIKRKKDLSVGENLETSTCVDTNPITFNNNTIPEYSKVIKRKKDTKLEEQLENCKCVNNNLTDYQIKFPYINCSEIVKTLPNEIQKYDDTASGEPVHYCNTEQRRRQSRASRKSLQYAILDHSGSIANLDALSYGAYDLPDFISCQYASIDFDKKAFIAPVRRPPSSWYKRHNKQNDKNDKK